MRIKSIKVQDFKRFSDLGIRNIPNEARLVVLVGPNGSGKSSLFDAFNYWTRFSRRGLRFDKDYHLKAGVILEKDEYVPDDIKVLKNINIQFYDFPDDPRESSEEPRKIFYFRSAYRNESDFSMNNLSKASDILDDEHKPRLMISSEARVSDNYQRIVSYSVDRLYDPSMENKLVNDLRDEIIGPVREAMQALFPDLVLSSMGKPMEGGTFLFDKGTSRNYHYKNLSGGEKASFDLLLDFVLKKDAFNDTVFCIDEPELHMNTKLQANLLEILYNELPPDCQLWIATHSIGMMRKAFELYTQTPNEVVFLDFTDRDFDKEQVMEPVIVDRQFWKKLFSVALDDLSELMAPNEIVFCEGSKEINTDYRNPSFDASVYRTIFNSTHPYTEFVPLGGTADIEKDSILLTGVLNNLFSSISMWCLYDRDDRSQIEITELKNKGIKVLIRRDLENYLWDDEVLKKLCDKHTKPEVFEQLKSEKDRLLEDASNDGQPADDVKYISGELYNITKTTLSLTGCGNNAVSFARDTLAPLISPEMKVYKELEEDIFN